jgi:ribosomal-protein-alanine N-acetyltransferase
MMLETRRFVLRDFVEADRPAFLAYQMDARYRALYGFGEEHLQRANDLFDRFLGWQLDEPRANIQLGIFGRIDDRLCGCAGLRIAALQPGTATLGIELTPDDWGRFRVAIEVAGALAGYGFEVLNLNRIMGSTASGNVRIAKLAGWFGARIVATRPGPEWMAVQGWHEVDWALNREEWVGSRLHRPLG